MRPADDHLTALDHATGAEPRQRDEVGHGRQPYVGLDRRRDDRPRDRMLGRRLDRRRDPQHVGRIVAASAAITPLDAHRAGGNGARLVEHDRVDAARRFEDLGPADDDAERRSAPRADEQRHRRREAQRAWARDDEHGDRAGERRVDRAAGEQPTGKRRDGRDQHGRHEDPRDAVGEPLHRRLAGLGLRDEPGHLGELRVGADAGGPDDQAAAHVDRPADDGRARCDFDRQTLAGHHAGVDGARAVRDHAVGREPFSRPYHEKVVDPQLRNGHAVLDAGAQDGRVLRSQLEQRAQRRAGSALGSDLHIAPDQQECHQGGADLEVEMAAGEQRDHTPDVGDDRAERDERVHRGRAVPEIRRSGAVEWPRAPGDDRRGEGKHPPRPARELPCRHHHDKEKRHGERCGDGQPRQR